jgi:hypothetical protein
MPMLKKIMKLCSSIVTAVNKLLTFQTAINVCYIIIMLPL